MSSTLNVHAVPFVPSQQLAHSCNTISSSTPSLLPSSPSSSNVECQKTTSRDWYLKQIEIVLGAGLLIDVLIKKVYQYVEPTVLDMRRSTLEKDWLMGTCHIFGRTTKRQARLIHWNFGVRYDDNDPSCMVPDLLCETNHYHHYFYDDHDENNYGATPDLIFFPDDGTGRYFHTNFYCFDDFNPMFEVSNSRLCGRVEFSVVDALNTDNSRLDREMSEDVLGIVQKDGYSEVYTHMALFLIDDQDLVIK